MKRQNFSLRVIMVIPLLAFLIANNARSQVQEYEAAFLYNFTRLIEWPPDYKTGTFIIGVIGRNEPIYKELGRISSKRKVSAQTIEVKEFETPASIGRCHVLFIPDNKSQFIGEAVNNSGKNPMVVISHNSKGISLGSAINLLIVNNKLNYEINPKELKESGLKINDQIISLAYKVYN
jgi:hypothetical protein